jgi:diacylglycerol O-acyltransferase
VRSIPGADAHYFYEERPELRPQTLKLLLLDTSSLNGELEVDALRRWLAPRVARLAPLRERAVRRPHGLGHGVWIEGGMPDLERHVRVVQARPPGDRLELCRLVAELASVALDRGHPLWELWVVHGLSPRVGAIVLKLHHSVADGFTAARLIEGLFGVAPGEEGVTPDPEPVPKRGELVTAGLAELARLAAKVAPTAARLVRSVRTTRALRGAGTLRSQLPFSAPAMEFNRHPLRERTFAYASAPLSQLDAVADANRARRGDVVVALIGSAMRDHLLASEQLPHESLTVVVPVSLRGAACSGVNSNNQVGNAFVTLATDLEDPVARLAIIRDSMAGFRANWDALDPLVWMDLWELYPLLRIGYLAGILRGRLTGRPTFSLIASTVSGPQDRLECAGLPVTAIHSAGMLTDDLALNITTWTYADQVSFALTTCPGFVENPEELVARIPHGLTELAQA